MFGSDFDIEIVRPLVNGMHEGDNRQPLSVMEKEETMRIL